MLSSKVKKKVIERDNNQCTNCKSREQLTVDHIIPKSLGGTNSISNLKTLCRGCNIMKSNKPPRYIRIYNWLFSRKTIYEFSNQLKHEMLTNDGEILR